MRGCEAEDGKKGKKEKDALGIHNVAWMALDAVIGIRVRD